MNTFCSTNPATGEIGASYALGSKEDVRCAVDGARARAEEWGQTSVEERCARLDQLRECFVSDADTIAQTVAAEVGKPLQEAFGADVLPSIRALAWVARNAPAHLRPRRIPGSRGATLAAEPLGVVGVIGTWNYPLFLNIAPIAWALATGNAVVWKPSELATGSALQLSNYLRRCGLPVEVVPGDGTTGRELCRAGCVKIAFTGGVNTGRAILSELAKTGTPSVMELSGNDPFIVCADAPVALAARSAVWARICSAGQSCVAPQRILVEASVYDVFLRAAQETLAGLRPDIDFGPMRTSGFRERVHRLVWQSVASGARLAAGGRMLEEKPGFYYAPTLLADCDEKTPAFVEEFFGPVLAVCPVRGEEESIRIANAGDMGLGASVWTRDLRRGSRIAERLHAGLVTINDTLLDAADPGIPFGGRGASGFGKQRGIAGLDEFLHWKVTVSHPTGGTRRHLFPYRDATLPVLRGIVAVQGARGWKQKLRAIGALGTAATHWEQSQKRDEVE